MAKYQTTCQHCGREYTARRSTSKYCSARCRKAASRERKQADETPVDVPTEAAKISTALDILARASDDQLRAAMWQLGPVFDAADALRSRCIRLAGLTEDEAREIGLL